MKTKSRVDKWTVLAPLVGSWFLLGGPGAQASPVDTALKPGAMSAPSAQSQVSANSETPSPRVRKRSPRKTPPCPPGDLLGAPGQRQLAILIGAGKHVNSELPSSLGPDRDVERMRAALVGDSDGRIPASHVCTLTGEQATSENVSAVFQSGIIDRATRGDSVLIYVAATGSQVRDLDGDELDDWDESILLYDSRSGSTPDFTDDAMAELLQRLAEKTDRIVLVMDTSDSAPVGVGSPAARGFRSVPSQSALSSSAMPQNGTAERFRDDVLSRNASVVATTASPLLDGDRVSGWGALDIPGLMVITAGSQGTAALEIEEGGALTSALLEALSGDASITGRDLAPVLRHALAPYGMVPSLQGAMDRRLIRVSTDPWASTARVRRLEAERLSLRLPALPGWNVGAELVVVAALQGAASPQMAEPLASALLTRAEKGGGQASFVALPGASRPVAAGDRVLLSRPGNDSLAIPVSLAQRDEPGALSVATRAAVLSALSQDALAGRVIRLSPTHGALRVRQSPGGALDVLGADGRVRNSVQAGSNQASTLVSRLTDFARQHALLQLQGMDAETGDQQAIRLDFTPDNGGEDCSVPLKTWQSGELLRLPSCAQGTLKISLNRTVVEPLKVGGVWMFSDGSLQGFPGFGFTRTLSPGESFEVPFPTASPGRVDLPQHLLVYGTPTDQPVSWSALARMREAPSGAGSVLETQLHGVVLGTRASNLSNPVESLEQISMTSHLSWVWKAAPERGQANEPSVPGTSFKQYRVQDLELEMLLAGVQNEGQRLLLTLADSLSRTPPVYGRHDWRQISDQANLGLGIDTSRAIWFLFTRAGLNYTASGSAIAPSGMVGTSSLLTDEFVRCDDANDLEVGDILVWRGGTHGIGHAAVVINPQNQLAWGGLILDGVPSPEAKDSVGVGYQRILYRRDWERLGMPDMGRVACWRHRQLSTQTAPIPQQ